MGVSARVRAWFASPRVLTGLALASIVANCAIVVTGGAVRLTSSGLGCPTWPSCTDSSLTPTKQFAAHGLIEFTNRQLTFVLGAIALATLVAAVVQHRQVALAALALAIIPTQAVIGGISVLTDLNPWVVALHFLTSMVAIAVTVVLWWRVRDVPAPPPVGPVAAALARLVLAVVAAVLVLGTIVTGSGPHAGDRNSSGHVHRTGLDVRAVSQLHADVVMLLIGLSVGLLVLLYAVRAPSRVRVAAWWLVGAELAQAAIGFTQYFLKVPAALVGVHMLGACLVWVAALRTALMVRPSEDLAHRVDDHSHQRPHDRAVDPNKLQVSPDL
jgi:heme a synthase